jgi:predicted TPR repeat methyltransferase
MSESKRRSGPKPDAGSPRLTLAQATQQAEALYQRGEWGEAEGLCRRILDAKPDSLEGLLLLGAIAAQTQRTREAAELFSRAVAVNPRSAGAHSNRGNALADLGDYPAALASFDQALALAPDAADIHVNRGAALAGLDRHEAALESFERAITLAPGHAEAHHNRAGALRALGRYEEALKSCDRALALNPGHAAAHDNRGNVLADLKRHAEALQSYERALALDPRHAASHYHRGLALAALKRHEAALQSYEQALALEPGRADIHYDRGASLQELKQPEAAIAAYRRALEAGDAERASYALAALGAGAPPAAAPAQYVSRLFDDYAEKFDDHLTGRLRYQTPALLAERVTRLFPSRDLDVLDLGCGTGLIGPLLRPLARSLVGVDLSGNMLEKARERGVYDDLVRAELTAFLETRRAAFDLVVASDVFTYIGDLGAVFAAVRAASRAGGAFGFSVEAGEEENFVLRPTRRYAHSESYLRDLARAHGFVTESVEPLAIRQEQDADVRGYLVVMRIA